MSELDSRSVDLGSGARKDAVHKRCGVQMKFYEARRRIRKSMRKLPRQRTTEASSQADAWQTPLPAARDGRG